MMKRLIFFSVLLIFSACSRDTATEPDCSDISNQTYVDLKLILSESCAYAGNCHLSGGAPGNFNSYAGVKDYLEDHSNEFISDVNSGRMPPNYAEPDDKKMINPLEILQLICWIEDGYPEE